MGTGSEELLSSIGVELTRNWHICDLDDALVDSVQATRYGDVLDAQTRFSDAKHAIHDVIRSTKLLAQVVHTAEAHRISREVSGDEGIRTPSSRLSSSSSRGGPGEPSP